MNRLAFAGLWLCAAVLAAQDADTIMREVQKRTGTKSERYQGVLKVTGGNSKVSEKKWTYERLGSHGESSAILRFQEPPEVKGVALLIQNHPDRSSDQWMWTPAIQRERRIALQDRSTRFFGTDFSFEDLEEREVQQFDYKLIGEENLNGVPTWKIESRPKKSKASQYSYSYVWVRKDQYAVELVENYDKNNKLVRRIDYSDFKTQDSIFAPRRIAVEDPARKSTTVLTIEDLQYNAPLKAENFTLQALRRGL